MRPPRLLIGGVLREATPSYPVIDPATEQEIARAPDASDADVAEAVAAARQAFDQTGWAREPGLRSRCLRQLKSALDEDFAALREITIAEAGVPVIPDTPWTGAGRVIAEQTEIPPGVVNVVTSSRASAGQSPSQPGTGSRPRSTLPGMLAGYKVPARTEFVPELVRSPTGKADYRWAREVLGAEVRGAGGRGAEVRGAGGR